MLEGSRLSPRSMSSGVQGLATLHRDLLASSHRLAHNFHVTMEALQQQVMQVVEGKIVSRSSCSILNDSPSSRQDFEGQKLVDQVSRVSLVVITVSPTRAELQPEDSNSLGRVDCILCRWSRFAVVERDFHHIRCLYLFAVTGEYSYAALHRTTVIHRF